MSVPPPFTPPGQKVGEGDRTKTCSTVTSQEESRMETGAPKATFAPVRCPVPSHRPAKAKEPCLVDEAGMKKWTSDMLKCHPGGHATTWEQWGNSSANQFKGVVDVMAH